jgi:hypothetical protein
MTQSVRPQNLDIDPYQGDTVPMKIVVKDENGVVVDLTGYSAKSTIFNTSNVAVANGFLCSVPNSSGEVFVYLPDGTSDLIQTGYRYDIEIWKSVSITELSGATKPVVATILEGRFTVVNDVTEVVGGGRGVIS